MKRSDSIINLTVAIAAVQAQMKGLQLDKEGHGYRYTTLPQVLAVLKDELFKNGLSVMQHPGDCRDKVTLNTLVMHSSGEWIESELIMPAPVTPKPHKVAQEIGSFITYARRYALVSIFAMGQGDEDAHVEEHVDVPRETPPARTDVYASKGQLDKLDALMIQTKTDPNKILSHYKIADFQYLQARYAESAIEMLNKKAMKMAAEDEKKEQQDK